MTTRPRPRRSSVRRPRPRATRPRLEALEVRLAPAVQLGYGGPGTALALLELASGATATVAISEPAPGQLRINLGAQTFDPTSTTSTAGLAYEVAGEPATSHFADIAIGRAAAVTALKATLPGDALELGPVANASGGLGGVAASAGVVTVMGLDTSRAGADGGDVDLVSAGALTVALGATLNAGTGKISLAADVNADGTGNDNVGALFIAAGAMVVSANPGSDAITLRGATVSFDTGPDPASIVSRPVGALPSTPTATLTGLSFPQALAFDAQGNLFVANSGNGTVSVFAPGGTTPTRTLTGLNLPQALAFDARGNLFVTNAGSGTVSVFAPGGTTPFATLTGLNIPEALALDARGDLFVANQGDGTVSVFESGGTTPFATLTGLNIPEALALDAQGNLFVANSGNDTVSVFAPGGTTPTRTLTGLNGPRALALDAQGDLFVANAGTIGSVGTTVSVFAPGGTTPTRTLTGLDLPQALALDARGNLFVANAGTIGSVGTTVSVFAPGRTTPSTTLTGLNSPQALALDAQGNLFVANQGNGTVSEFVGVPEAGGVVIRASRPGQAITVGGGAAAAGLSISGAELARIVTTATGTVTFGDAAQAGDITFAGAAPATTPGATVAAVQSTSGPGRIVLDDANGTALDAGPGGASLEAGSGGIVAAGGGTAADIAATGPVALDTTGGVGSARDAITFDAQRTPAGVTVIAAGATGVYLAGQGALNLVDVRTADAPLVATAATTLTVSVVIGAGTVTLTAPNISVSAGAAITADAFGTLFVVADTMTILGTLGAANGIVTLEPLTATRNIDLGGTGPATDLVLDDATLGRVTAGTLRIGGAPAGTGDITITGAVTAHPGYATLSLQTVNGRINGAGGATLAAANLALQAGDGIGTTGTLLVAATDLAFASRSGPIRISNAGAVTLKGVDELAGSSIPGDITSSSVVGSVYTILTSSGGVSGQISYNGRALSEGEALRLADGHLYRISYQANGGRDVTLTRIAEVVTEAPSPVVTTLADVVDPTDGVTSLREAIAYANSHPGPDTIVLAPGVLGRRPLTVRLAGGPLVLTDPATTTIRGPGATRLTIQGDGRSRVFDVQGGSLALSGLTVSGGRADNGGGIRNDGGRLALTGVVLRGNSAGILGGGLFNDGRARLTNVVVRGNSARVGGGIVNLGTLALARVAIRGNFARFARGLFSSKAARLIRGG
jgi:CSLREA domain-containing protein